MSDGLIRHRIYDALRGDIMACQLPPGEELRESVLAQRFGVSKSPIRDALQRLEFEGLITIEPRRGHRISQISMADARDILEMRAIIEAGAVRKLARDAPDRALAGLDAFRTADTTSLEAYADYNRRFHSALCDLSGNMRLCDTMARLMENYGRLCAVSLSTQRTVREAMEGAIAEHCQIIDAIQARNGAAAARMSARHLQRSQKQIMRGLRTQAVQP